MADRRIGIILNGATGRVGTNHHLVRSLLAIRNEGGLPLAGGDRVVPDPILVGRDADRLERLARAHGVARWTTDLDAALSDPADGVFFDAASTRRRAALVRRAIAAGKHVYVEKPSAETLAEALELHALAEAAGVRHGVVQNQIYLPGPLKLKALVDAGFFGRILSVRIDFGYWVFEGDRQPAQRPSWNYRKADGGGIVLDTMPHWRYMLDHLFGEVESVLCHEVTAIERRWDEAGEPYRADADDGAFAILRLRGGIVAQVNFDWCVRVRADDTLTIKVDGTAGSAVAGMSDCWTQARTETPRAIWNPDQRDGFDGRRGWLVVPDTRPAVNPFRAGWERFLRHLHGEGEWRHGLIEGAKGLQLVDAAHRSHAERKWIDLAPID